MQTFLKEQGENAEFKERILRNVIVIGSGGHAKVILDIIEKSGDKVLGILDKNRLRGECVLGYPVIGSEMDNTDEFVKDNNYFVIGIGDNCKRRNKAEMLALPWYTAIHPSAIIGKSVEIGEGTVVMANAVINPNAKIGCHCIVNTAASIDHDVTLKNYVHVSPNAAIAGKASIGEECHIGIGVSVIDNISICEKVQIGAGAAVIEDIRIPGVYVGVPVHRIKKWQKG